MPVEDATKASRFFCAALNNAANLKPLRTSDRLLLFTFTGVIIFPINKLSNVKFYAN